MIINKFIENTNMKKSLQQQNDDFVELLVHDLKSPVNSQMSAIDIIVKNINVFPPEKLTEMLTDIGASIKFMKQLVENANLKYKFERNEKILKKEMYSLKALIINCIEEYKYLANGKNLSIKFDFNVMNEIIFMDIVEIKRVMQNLLTNAIEKAPKNSVIEIAVTENKKFMVVSVTNRSNGKPIKNPDELFDKYITRAKEEKKINSGLGLYIAKNIVLAHGGTINIDVTNPNYVRFFFTLPR